MIPDWLSNLATGRAVVFALLVWVGAGSLLFQVGPYPQLESLAQGQELLDERMGYSWQDAMILFAVLGEGGRQAYRIFLVADVGNAILMVAAFTLLLTWLLSRLDLAGSMIAGIVLLPVAAGVFDLLENMLLLTALGQFAEVSESIVGLASIATQAKLILGSTTFLLAAIGLALWAWRRLRDRRLQT